MRKASRLAGLCVSILTAGGVANAATKFYLVGLAATLGGALVFEGGTHMNDSTANIMTVEFPMPLSGSTLLTGGQFIVWDRNSTAQVSCILWNATSFTSAGLATGSSVTGSTTAAFNSGKTTIAVDSADESAAYVFGHCEIPVKSGANRSGIGQTLVN